MHGRNERVAVKDVYASKEFLYRLVKQLAAPATRSTARRRRRMATFPTMLERAKAVGAR